ncbi:MAG: TadE/TadG family type IV pilus assembly protein [Bythopirellula sp.]
MINRNIRHRYFCFQSRGPDRRGVAAVEFAIVAPIFFMLVFGCIEFGRALMVQQILTNASRVGARQAITLNASESAVVSAASSYASSTSVPGVNVSVSPSPGSAKAGDMVSVTVAVPFNNISWIPAPWFMGGATLDATSVMRKEGFE